MMPRVRRERSANVCAKSCERVRGCARMNAAIIAASANHI
jgi:hypothetical protein